MQKEENEIKKTLKNTNRGIGVKEKGVKEERFDFRKKERERERERERAETYKNKTEK